MKNIDLSLVETSDLLEALKQRFDAYIWFGIMFLNRNNTEDAEELFDCDGCIYTLSGMVEEIGDRVDSFKYHEGVEVEDED